MGYGNLGRYLENNLKNHFNYEIFPLKDIEIPLLESYLKSQFEELIIIDLMDPNKITKDTNLDYLKKASKVREIISLSNNLNQYIFISTANLYLPSKKKIYESGDLIMQSDSEYLTLKINTEFF